MFKYNALVKRVVDGDTFDLDVDLGFSTHVHIRSRLLGVDAYEKSRRDNQTEDEKQLGIKCKEYFEKVLTNKNVIIKVHKDHQGKYGRWLIELEYMESDSGIGEILNAKDVIKSRGWERK